MWLGQRVQGQTFVGELSVYELYREGLLVLAVGMSQTGRPSIPSTQTANEATPKGQKRYKRSA